MSDSMDSAVTFPKQELVRHHKRIVILSGAPQARSRRICGVTNLHTKQNPNQRRLNPTSLRWKRGALAPRNKATHKRPLGLGFFEHEQPPPTLNPSTRITLAKSQCTRF